MPVANTIKFLSAVTLATFGMSAGAFAADLPEHATVTVDGGKTTVNTEAHKITPSGSVHTSESASQQVIPTDDGAAEEVTEESTTTAIDNDDQDKNPATDMPDGD